jgi:UDP-N-acetylglucosamine--N-acetylmuramyl-(pentapeptide) pyrophosphoryl-undecaprenol N-acetylglucosamine transferase
MPPLVALAAGGTGGHLFPAESLARVLKARGCRVELLSDDRVLDFAATFPADAIHQVRSGTVTGKGLVGKIMGALRLAQGVSQCRALLKRINPDAMVGFGGYPTVPPVRAASMLGIPTILHEQNAVMGRANRFLSKRATRIATGFPIGGGTAHVGNPVRAAVIEAAAHALPAIHAGGPLHLLVFGGSQGARVMGEIVPPALELLSSGHRARLKLAQQVRAEDLDAVKARYAALHVEAECAPFFRDLPQRMAASHLVIGRAGASTVAELTVIGRGAILVPLPGSLDQDQAANARILADAGGAEVILQPGFTPEALADRLAAFLDAPATLIDMARNAREIGISDAAERLADLVLEVAGERKRAKALASGTEG